MKAAFLPHPKILEVYITINDMIISCSIIAPNNAPDVWQGANQIEDKLILIEGQVYCWLLVI